LLWFEA